MLLNAIFISVFISKTAFMLGIAWWLSYSPATKELQVPTLSPQETNLTSCVSTQKKATGPFYKFNS